MIAVLFSSAAQALSGPSVAMPHVTATLVSASDVVVPGRPLKIELRLKMIPGWHTYWENPGDAGLPPAVDWQLPAGVQATPLQFPVPQLIKEGPITTFGYEGVTNLITTLEIPPDSPDFTENTYTFSAAVNWLVCEKICVPEKANLTLTLPRHTTGAPLPPPAHDFEIFPPFPVQSDIAATFYREEGDFVINIPDQTALIPVTADLYFFPTTPETVFYSAPQTLNTTSTGIQLRQKVSEYFDPQISNRRIVVRTDAGYLHLTATKAAPPLKKTTISFIVALGLAFIGGIFLNLMPCVFPILSIKVLSYVNKSGKERRHVRLSGLVFTGGVVVSFIGIALILIALKSGGEEIGWGFQLQSPYFVMVLAYLLFMLGLSLSGLITFGTRIMGLGAHLTERDGYQGAFFTGVLATVVATPCTAPFMGTAMGFALTQPAAFSLSIFGTLGLGMAFPFLALTWWPQLLRYLPKPGPWMDTFKQFMAFPIYLTVAWLVWVFSLQTSAAGTLSILIGLVLIAFASWLYSPAGRPISKIIAFIAIIASLGFLFQIQPSNGKNLTSSPYYKPYSTKIFQELRKNNQPVFINMTAAWCITCLANDQLVLDTEEFRAHLKHKGITYLKGDWTNYNNEITRFLESHGRQGVPLYVYYKDTATPPVILPQLLTLQTTLDYLQ